ncbi:MAG: hypothetical protein K2P45_04490 [Eubacterium sp.]|nr:hypothetical protein [Eubacterium sp.]
MIFGHFEQKKAFYHLLYERSLACAAYSLYGWIEVWFQRGMQESAEEMTTPLPVSEALSIPAHFL